MTENQKDRIIEAYKIGLAELQQFNTIIDGINCIEGSPEPEYWPMCKIMDIQEKVYYVEYEGTDSR